MIREYWAFIFLLRKQAGEPSVSEAILFGMLIILEVLEPRQAAEYFPKQVIETQSYAAGINSRDIVNSDVFQTLDEGKSKMLAGGILMKTKEIVTKHERLLLGDVISFGSISSSPMGLKFR